MSAFAVEKPRGDHDLSTFGCGKEELNRFLKRFLKRFALANQQAKSAQTYVACEGNLVVDYISRNFLRRHFFVQPRYFTAYRRASMA